MDQCQKNMNAKRTAVCIQSDGPYSNSYHAVIVIAKFDGLVIERKFVIVL